MGFGHWAYLAVTSLMYFLGAIASGILLVHRRWDLLWLTLAIAALGRLLMYRLKQGLEQQAERLKKELES